MRRTIQRALIIVVASAALGLLANAVSPRGIPYIRPPKPEPAPQDLISLEEAQALWGAAVFLDARVPAEYAAGHIPHAFNLPAESFEQQYPRVAPLLSPDLPIIVYCDGVECELSHRVADRLRAQKYANVRVLVNGWTVWRTSGMPTETGEHP